MLAVSVYGGVEPQRTQSPHHVDTSSGIDFVKHMGRPVTSAWYHAASRLWAGSNFNRLRQGN